MLTTESRAFGFGLTLTSVRTCSISSNLGSHEELPQVYIAFTRFLLSLAWCNAVGLRSRRARMMSSLRHHDRRFWPPGPFALCHKYYVRDDDARGADVVRDRGKYYQLPAPTRAAMCREALTSTSTPCASCNCHVSCSLHP